ncbi:uncharacterized protein DUF3140 [Frondihabitans sp. PhB188]|uniref:DUF3140 domain-containing protein n=1 Tax=Frondihabitans sp. PhB188 TaxID=2485200 RepID=UPI000F464031|nr:DUF3140 domain-containing protein [Frondihabitans sp. PhB188]ROQ37224.1 uncharacterized protein DUF3140 [Frondihabitans sp. PhB188]
MTKDDHEDTRHEFGQAVNMTASEIEEWLGTDESKGVGQKTDGHESVGHESGRHIIRILKKKQADLTDADYAHMRKVIGYVARHSKQRPEGDISETPWRYSLMNWGNDPQKKK